MENKKNACHILYLLNKAIIWRNIATLYQLSSPTIICKVRLKMIQSHREPLCEISNLWGQRFDYTEHIWNICNFDMLRG